MFICIVSAEHHSITPWIMALNRTLIPMMREVFCHWLCCNRQVDRPRHCNIRNVCFFWHLPTCKWWMGSLTVIVYCLFTCCSLGHKDVYVGGQNDFCLCSPWRSGPTFLLRQAVPTDLWATNSPCQSTPWNLTWNHVILHIQIVCDITTVEPVF